MTNHPFELAAAALEREADKPRNKQYRAAFLEMAAQARADAKRIPDVDCVAGNPIRAA